MAERLHPADRIVIHVDMDAFFASVEERERPGLRGRPVIVGSDPRGGQGRGIVATCNYEARRFGLRSAMPISIAYRLCPRGVFLRPRMPLYGRVSERVMAALRSRADLFEQAGIDEAYLDVSSLRTFEAARDAARELRARILREERLSASFGIAPNKLVAKIASDHRKPGGLTAVIPSRVREFLDPKDIGVLWGVGPKTKERLLAMGYPRVCDLRQAADALLAADFGKFGAFLKREAEGQDDRPVDPAWIQRSIGRENTFETDTRDAALIASTLAECVRDVHRDMLDGGHWCRTLAVKVRFAGYETHSRQTTLKLATGSLAHLQSGARALAEPLLEKRRRAVRLIGFSVATLAPPEELLPLGLD